LPLPSENQRQIGLGQAEGNLDRLNFGNRNKGRGCGTLYDRYACDMRAGSIPAFDPETRPGV